MLDLNRPMRPPMSDLPFSSARNATLAEIPKARSDKRACLRTVEVGHEHETPPWRPRDAATPFPFLKAAANFDGPASGVRE